MIVFLTGMSGTGKSSVIDELIKRGYDAVDLDEPPWSEYDDGGDWIWDEARVHALLGEERELLFVSGCPTNQVRFYPSFDKIILLSAPTEVIKERLRSRTNNSYGKPRSSLPRSWDTSRPWSHGCAWWPTTRSIRCGSSRRWWMPWWS